VVDDDEAMRHISSVALARVGEVTTCPDAYLALAVLRDERVDAVVLDLMMPGVSGADLLELLAREGIMRPTVVVTGMGNGPLVDRVRALGAYVLPKPYRPDALVAAVERALADATPPVA